METQIMIPNKREIEKMDDDGLKNMALEIRDKLLEVDMGSQFIVDKVKFLLDNCYTTTNTGLQSFDTKTYLETLKFVTKLLGVKVVEGGTTQIAIFNNVGEAKKDGRINF